MKHLFLSILTLAATTSSFAAIKHRKYAPVLTEITALEQAGDLRAAALTAAIEAQTLADRGGFDEIVSSIETKLQENREEVVTESVRRGAGFSILFGLLGGSAHQNYDIARILTTNPSTVARFTSMKETQFRRLQGKIQAHAQKNETELFYAKALTAKALQVAAGLPHEELKEIYGYLTETAQRVSRVSFLGLQNITSCTQTDYAQRSRSWGVALSGIISFNIGESHNQNPYRETTCNRTTVTASESELALRSVDIMLADQALQLALSRLSLKMFDEATAPIYPTWGSSYIKP